VVVGAAAEAGMAAAVMVVVVMAGIANARSAPDSH
jgi:hypothetical protein